MRASQLSTFLEFCVKNRFPVLVKGKPGAGKSDITEQVRIKTGYDLILSHPVVSDPTDFKGFPFAKNENEADFLPYGDLLRAINADKPTIFFLDDLGQAPAAVQAACMQLLLARQIGQHKISDHVTFIAATNRREDMAGVSGMLEPVKSRFVSIVELEINVEDWTGWAIDNNLPSELISFVKFRPSVFEDNKPTKDIVNTASPRTLSHVGKLQIAGIDAGHTYNDVTKDENTYNRSYQYEIFKGAAGEAFAAQYMAFLRIYRNLPDMEEVIKNPKSGFVPTDPSTRYAISGALASRANRENIANIMEYLERLPEEINVACVKECIRRNESIVATAAFTKWSIAHNLANNYN